MRLCKSGEHLPGADFDDDVDAIRCEPLGQGDVLDGFRHLHDEVLANVPGVGHVAVGDAAEDGNLGRRDGDLLQGGPERFFDRFHQPGVEGGGHIENFRLKALLDHRIGQPRHGFFGPARHGLVGGVAVGDGHIGNLPAERFDHLGRCGGRNQHAGVLGAVVDGLAAGAGGEHGFFKTPSPRRDQGRQLAEAVAEHAIRFKAQLPHRRKRQRVRDQQGKLRSPNVRIQRVVFLPGQFGEARQLKFGEHFIELLASFPRGGEVLHQGFEHPRVLRSLTRKRKRHPRRRGQDFIPEDAFAFQNVFAAGCLPCLRNRSSFAARSSADSATIANRFRCAAWNAD